MPVKKSHKTAEASATINKTSTEDNITSVVDEDLSAVTKSPKAEEVADDGVTEPKHDKNKRYGKWEPITKGHFILKLIPFILLSALWLSLFILVIVLAFKQNNQYKVGIIISAVVGFACLSIFPFIAFSMAFCQINEKHNKRMKKILAKLIVPVNSKNGAFPVRRWYLENDNLYAWKCGAPNVIEAFKKVNAAEYEEYCKYYREHKW